MLLAAAIVGLVLLQRGKGADAGAGFGAGASGTVFGARGSASFLSRTTATLAALFFATQPDARVPGRPQPKRRRSVIDRVQAAPTPAPDEQDAAAAVAARRRQRTEPDAAPATAPAQPAERRSAAADAAAATDAQPAQ